MSALVAWGFVAGFFVGAGFVIGVVSRTLRKIRGEAQG